MPSPKRWFPCSRDIALDPEVWEFMKLFGDRALMLLLTVLSMLDQRDNRWLLSGEWLASLSRLVRQTPATVRRALDWMIGKGWLTVAERAADGSPTVLRSPNYFKYHRSAERKGTDAGSHLGTNREPYVTPSEPSLSFPNRTEQKEKKKKATFSSDSTEVRLSELLLNLILARNPSHKIPKLQDWAKAIDLMRRLDHRTPEDIEQIIHFSQEDPFWSTIVISTSKLREKFDQLVLIKRSPNQPVTKGNGHGLVSRMQHLAKTSEHAQHQEVQK